MTEIFLIGGEQKNQAVKTDGICTCLTSSMGTGGGYIPMIIFEEMTETQKHRNTETQKHRNTETQKIVKAEKMGMSSGIRL